jgi:hypothetical protein
VDDQGTGNMIEQFQAQMKQASITTIRIMHKLRCPLLNLGEFTQINPLPTGQAIAGYLGFSTFGIRKMISSQSTSLHFSSDNKVSMRKCFIYPYLTLINRSQLPGKTLWAKQPEG